MTNSIPLSTHLLFDHISHTQGKTQDKYKILPTSHYGALKTYDENGRKFTPRYVDEKIPYKWEVPLVVTARDKLPKIRLKIKQVSVNNCFIDTGASRTIITHKLAKRIFGRNYRRTLGTVDTVLLDAGD